MPRPVAIHDDVIVEAARKVFLARGYRGSTMDVACLAGVSEGSIFKRFKTKANLFLAAMDVESREQSWQERLLAAAGTDDVRRTLVEYGRHLLERLQIITPRMLMVNASGIAFAKGYRFPEPPPPVQHIRRLARYFRSEIRCGRMAMASPETQAHVFVGALSHYVFCETVFHYRSAPPGVFVRTVAEMIVRVSQPAGKRVRCVRVEKKRRQRS